MAIAKPTKRKGPPPEAQKFADFLTDRYQTHSHLIADSLSDNTSDRRVRLKTELAELLIIQTEFKRIFKLK